MNAFEQLEKKQQQSQQQNYSYPQQFSQQPPNYGNAPQYNSYAPSNFQYAPMYYNQPPNYWQPQYPQQQQYGSYQQIGNASFPSYPPQQQNSQFNSPVKQNNQQTQQHDVMNCEEDPTESTEIPWKKPVTQQDVNSFMSHYLPWLKPDDIQPEINTQIKDQQEELKNLARTNPGSAAAMKTGIKSPDKLTQYIERAFQKCVNTRERDFMEKTLQSITQHCKEKGNLFTRDWDIMPLPQLQREGPNYEQNNKNLETQDSMMIQFQSQANQLTGQSVFQQTPSLLQKQSQILNKSPQISGNTVFVNNQGTTLTKEEIERRRKREEKFKIQEQVQRQSESKLMKPKQLISLHSMPDFSQDLDEITKNLTIKGTCTNLEKPYFRLTRAPDPSEVRPENILKKTLSMLKKKWKNNEADYTYVDEQFRSMRQDLTVQRIQNQFCVEVYETHARIAIECCDLDQFNQCQTQLHYLYKKGNKGNQIVRFSFLMTLQEFLAYRILYYVLCEMETETMRIMKELTDQENQQEEIQHALEVRKQLAKGNYGRFFKLYRDAPNMGSYLMDVFIDKHRILYLQRICLGYIAANINAEYVSALLAFDTFEDFKVFITGLGCKLDESKKERVIFPCRENLPILKKAPLKVKMANK